MKETISAAEASQRLALLVGMPVSGPRKGYGSTIFLELGVLTCPDRRTKGRGEACIWLDWGWRLESDSEIICGSSDTGPKISDCLGGRLEGETILDVAFAGRPPELVVTLTRGRRLRSMAMVGGPPQWSIRFSDGSWLGWEGDTMFLSEGTDGDGLTEAEKRQCVHAETTAERWGKPTSEPMLGRCRQCWFHLRLDASFDFLDYGVCSAPGGAFDGRTTHLDSGCAKFVDRKIQ